jgi:hypothetical protein
MDRVRFTKKELLIIRKCMVMSNGELEGVDGINLPEHKIYKLYKTALEKINIKLLKSK